MCKIDDFVCVRVDFPFYNFPSCKDVSNFLQFDAGLRFNTFFVLFSRVKGVVDRVRSLIVIFKKFAYWRYSNWILHYQSQPCDGRVKTQTADCRLQTADCRLQTAD